MKQFVSDQQTTLQNLKDEVRTFVEERDWRKFHSPKNLAMSLAIETSELMEHFQWLTTEESRDLDDSVRSQAAEELADVICYALGIANELEIDIATTFQAKMAKNRQKYPVEQIRGRYGHQDPNPVSET